MACTEEVAFRRESNVALQSEMPVAPLAKNSLRADLSVLAHGVVGAGLPANGLGLQATLRASAKAGATAIDSQYAQPSFIWRSEKSGPDGPDALGRSRDGLSTKIQMLCDANGTPLRFLLSGAQAGGVSYAQPLLDDISISSSQRGRLRKRCKWLLPTRALTPKPYAATATDIECNPSPRVA